MINFEITHLSLFSPTQVLYPILSINPLPPAHASSLWYRRQVGIGGQGMGIVPRSHSAAQSRNP